jgi:hypothetical protein
LMCSARSLTAIRHGATESVMTRPELKAIARHCEHRTYPVVGA